METLEDLLTFYADELETISHILKKYRDVRNFVAYDENSKPIEIKNKKQMIQFVKTELESLIESLESVEGA